MFHDGSAWAVILWFRQSRYRGVPRLSGVSPTPRRQLRVS
jgi:hypothetical protein